MIIETICSIRNKRHDALSRYRSHVAVCMCHGHSLDMQGGGAKALSAHTPSFARQRLRLDKQKRVRLIKVISKFIVLNTGFATNHC